MGFTKANHSTTYHPSFRHSLSIFSLVLVSFSFLLLGSIFRPHPPLIDIIGLRETQSSISFPHSNRGNHPKWLDAIRGAHLTNQRPLRVGLVNCEGTEQLYLPGEGIAQYITIDLEPASQNVTWKILFPEWISEKTSDKCPIIAMPEPGKYVGLDVVVAKLPCGDYTNCHNGSREKGIRDVHRLQISLAISRLIVEDGSGKEKDVYVVFITKCEPMVEIFKCDDLVWHGDSYWVYKPNVEKLTEILSIPIGACELAHPYTRTSGTSYQLQESLVTVPNLQLRRSQMTGNVMRKEAYVTVLHSSEIYVCGAIALARSILQTNTTKDLILLADKAISNHSIKGLQSAGWKIKRIRRIKNPNAKADAYNKWNYSKLRVWQLTKYDKVMFIDSDFIVLQNIDHFFNYPQISAGPNDRWLFNSGIMIIEPSKCFFKHLMSKRYTLKSYNGGDQGYLNEVLTWWHRLTRKLNFMKFYAYEGGNRLVPTDRYTIHYLGYKPWLCYRDYDCNWDKQDHHKFASDDVHGRWWKVYDGMPKELQGYCGLTKQLNYALHARRVEAENVNLSDGHWKIHIKDPRQQFLLC